MNYTDEQQAVIERAVTLGPGENLKVIAMAGSGKTTTLNGVAKARGDRGIYLAFNKVIADEAKKKLALTRSTANTMHALTYKSVREMIGSPLSINARTIRESRIMERHFIPNVQGWNNYRVAAAVGRALSAFCNSADDDFSIAHGEDAIVDALGDPDMIRDRNRREAAREALKRLAQPVSEMAASMWTHLLEQGQMSHDMYLKAHDLDPDLRRKAFSSFTYLMVDEGQDSNPVQTSIISKTGLPVITVGDPYQQIYSWRGAENALARIEGESLYLTQSFRFAENIASVARHILASRPDGGPEQHLVGLGGKLSPNYKGPKIAIICRTNMGVIDEALTMMRKGKTIKVDNMEGLLADVRSAQALYEGRNAAVTSASLRHFETWDEFKIEAEEGDQSLAKIVSLIEDGKTESIEELAAHQSRAGDKAQFIICTAHRSKGAEFAGVKCGNDWRNLGQMQKRYHGAKQKSEKHVTAALEEFNAFYVMATRSVLQLAGHEKLLEVSPVNEYDDPVGYTPMDIHSHTKTEALQYTDAMRYQGP